MQQFTIINTLTKRRTEEKSLDNENEFIHIFETYYKRIYNYMYYRTSCSATSEDLASKVFEKIMLNLCKYEEKKGSLDVWIFAIARNVSNDHFRLLKKHSFLSFSFDSLSHLVSKMKTPEDTLLATEASHKLSEAINNLDERERHIIALKFYGCLKNNAIAKILNITENNVGVIIYRSMKKLKNKLEGEELV